MLTRAPWLRRHRPLDETTQTRTGWARRWLIGLLWLGAAAAPAVQAASLYSNFDKNQTAPLDYSTSTYADISGYFVNCCVIFSYGAGFNFTAQATGTPTTAWVALDAIVAGDGGGNAERFFRLSIYDSTRTKIVAQGGLLGRYIPVSAQPAVYEFALGRDGNYVEAGQVLTTSANLVSGQSYFALFYQSYGALSQTHWMVSDEPGSSDVLCVRNYDSNPCAGPGQSYYSASSLSTLPTLTLADKDGLPLPDGNNQVPAPGALLLLAAGLPWLLRSRVEAAPHARNTGLI